MQMNTRVFTYLEDLRIPIPGPQHKTWLSQRRQTEREHLLRWSGYIRHMDTTSAKWLMTEVSYALPCINTLQITALPENTLITGYIAIRSILHQGKAKKQNNGEVRVSAGSIC